jgi:putative transcriptional regulator
MYSREPDLVLQPALERVTAINRRKMSLSMRAMLMEIVRWASLLQCKSTGGMGESFKSFKGQLLLDGGKLSGSFFHRTVILLCQHDPEGAFGLVLNRSTDNKVGEMVVADLPESLKDQALYLGGPVQPTALSFLHTDTCLSEANVMSNLNLSHSLDSLVELGQGFSTTQQIRVFAGYAGWGPGQLEDEMKRKAWLLHPANLEAVFTTNPANLWRTILNQKGWQYRLLAEGPDDPALN